MWWLSVTRNILVAEPPLKEWGVPVPHQSSLAQASRPGVPRKSSCENQWGFWLSRWDGRQLEIQTSLYWTHTQTHSQALTLGSSRKIAPQDSRDIQGRLNCVAPEWGLEVQLPLSLCWTLFFHRLQVRTILPMLNLSPTQPKLKQHWYGEIWSLHPSNFMRSLTIQLTNRPVTIAGYWNQPHFVLSVGFSFSSKQQASPLISFGGEQAALPLL